MEHRFLQFELWKDCNNKCKFCFNNNSKTTAKSKEEKIGFILRELDNPDYYNIKNIGFIGGEFFDGQLETKELEDKFILLLNKVLENPKINQVLLTTSLLFLSTLHFDYVLSRLSNRKKILLCTSWDTKYRFHTFLSQKMWENNLAYLHERYPEIKVHVEICPTQWHIEEVLLDLFNIKNFENFHKVWVDYTDLNSGFNYKDKYEFQKHVPGFFPKRETFIRFLYKVYSERQATPDKFLNFEYMSTLLWMEVNGKYQKIEGYRGPLDGVTENKSYPLPPMHENQSDYIDSHVRMRKDVLDVWENMYG